MELIYGEDIVASRNYLNKLKEEAKEAGRSVVNFEPKRGVTELVQAIEGGGLFGDEALIVVEGALKIKEVGDYLIKQAPTNLKWWEEGKVNKTIVNKLRGEVKEFAIKKELFTFLESLKPRNQKTILSLWERLREDEAAEMVFFMLLRQWKQLIAAVDGGIEGPSWLQGKLRAQGAMFGLERLLKLHEQLYEIEKKVKTGRGLLTLEEEMEIWMMGL